MFRSTCYVGLTQELEAKWTFFIGCGRFVTVKVGVYRGWKLKKSIDGTDNTFITKGAFKLIHDLAKVVDRVLAGEGTDDRVWEMATVVLEAGICLFGVDSDVEVKDVEEIF